MIKKYLTFFAVVSLIAGNSLIASAQTTTTPSSLQVLLQTLQTQMATLKAQVDAQNKLKAEIKTTTSEIKGTLKLISKLREGASGDDVKLLQEILASDSSVYPEGKITGFFGKLTAQAVKRFQKKHGLEQVGNVGSKTLEKLNKELEKNPIANDDDDEDKKDNENHGEKRHCAIVPPGHLIAPGWLKKEDGVRPILPACQKLPHGIEKKLNESTSTATSTPDVLAPIISGISVTGISSSSAHVVWTTNEAATSKVSYATSTPVNVATAAMVNDGAFVTSHNLAIPNLTASTTYYYVVSSWDAAVNTATSSESSFATTQ